MDSCSYDLDQVLGRTAGEGHPSRRPAGPTADCPPSSSPSGPLNGLASVAAWHPDGVTTLLSVAHLTCQGSARTLGNVRSLQGAGCIRSLRQHGTLPQAGGGRCSGEGAGPPGAAGWQGVEVTQAQGLPLAFPVA